MEIIATLCVIVIYITLTYLLANDLFTNDFKNYDSKSKVAKILVFIALYIWMLILSPLMVSIAIAIKLYSWIKNIK